MSEEPEYLQRIRLARARWQQAEAALNEADIGRDLRRAIGQLLGATDSLLEEAEHLHDRLNGLERTDSPPGET